jgi:hypothetical protein
MKLYSKLVNIRKAVEYLQKTERGNQGAMYVDPAVLVRKIREKMDEHGILLVPSLKNSSIESMPDPTKNNPDAKSFLFRSEMVYTFIDAEDGSKLDVDWFMTGKHLQDPAMAGGAALTYFERYFLLKFFQIPTSKDDPEHFQAKTATTLTDDQIKELSDLIDRTGTDIRAFLKHAKADTLENIQPAKFGVLKAMLLTKEQKVKGAA